MKPPQNFTLKEIAKITGCELKGDPLYQISNVADLQNATETDAAFLMHVKYFSLLEKSVAGVVFVPLELALSEKRNYLLSSNPSRDFQKLIDLLHPASLKGSGFSGIHPSAVIHPSAKLGEHVSIGPYVVLDQYVEIGDHTNIEAHSYIGPYTTIGQFCKIKPRVTVLENCQIGNQVTLESGTVIGSCGFGYTTDAKGHSKLDHIGNVVIRDNVDIGANTTIDRARFKSTFIEQGTKIDNLVHIAHNVEIGKNSLIAAQVGFAGSTKLGEYCMVGGQAGFTGHITIGNHIRIAAKSGVSKSLIFKENQENDYGGIPAVPLSQHQRTQALVRQLAKFIQKLKNLEALALFLNQK